MPRVVTDQQVVIVYEPNSVIPTTTKLQYTVVETAIIHLQLTTCVQ